VEVVEGADEVTQGITCPRVAKGVERVYSSLKIKDLLLRC
jgi:hypothetical protein